MKLRFGAMPGEHNWRTADWGLQSAAYTAHQPVRLDNFDWIMQCALQCNDRTPQRKRIEGRKMVLMSKHRKDHIAGASRSRTDGYIFEKLRRRRASRLIFQPEGLQRQIGSKLLPVTKLDLNANWELRWKGELRPFPFVGAERMSNEQCDSKKFPSQTESGVPLSSLSGSSRTAFSSHGLILGGYRWGDNGVIETVETLKKSTNIRSLKFVKILLHWRRMKKVHEFALEKMQKIWKTILFFTVAITNSAPADHLEHKCV